MSEIKINCAFLRLPRLKRELYRELAFAENFEICFNSEKFDDFRNILSKENPNFYQDIIPVDSYSLKQKITILNYLMRATSRCSPYKNFSADVPLLLGERNHYRFSKITCREKSYGKNTPRNRRAIDPIVTQINNGHLYVNSQRTQFSKRDSVVQEEFVNLVSDNNPFLSDYQKSYLEFHLDQSEIDTHELRDIADTLNSIRFLNGNHVNRSIYWIEKIRKELFNLVDAKPVELRKALIGLGAMQTSKQELVFEVDKRILPVREKFMEIACSTKKEVELSNEDILFFKEHQRKVSVNLSQEYSVIMTPSNDKSFVEFYRASYRGFRAIAETITKYDSWKPSIKNNDQIIFFDLISTGKKDVLQSRPQNTEYGLSVDGSLIPDGIKEIELDDLYVYASNVELVLFSKKLNKRVLPILTTNYLAENETNLIFKFLASLSKIYFNDGLFIDLSWLKTPHIPRISYKGIILFPETWNIKKEEITFRLNELPDQFRVIEGDRKLLIHRDSIYSLEQMQKIKGALVTLTEDITDKQLDRHHEVSFQFSTNNKVDELNFYPFNDEIDLHFNKKYKINELRISLLFNLMESFVLANLKEELIELPFYFVSYHFPNPEIRLRILGEREEFLKIKNRILMDRFFYNITNIVEVDYRREPNKYIDEYGEKLYIDSNVQLTRGLMEVKRLALSLTEHRYDKFGSPGEIAYLAFLTDYLLGIDSLDLKVANYSQESSHSIEKQIFEFMRHNSGNPLMKILENKAKKMAMELMPNIEKFNELVKNSCLDKPKNYLALRLLHIEVFRLCLLPPSDYNSLAFNLAKRLQRSAQSKVK